MSAQQTLRPELIARMTAVETFIGSRARPTTTDLLFFLKLGRNQTSEALRHLVSEGRIHEAKGVGTKIWATGRKVEVHDDAFLTRESMKVDRRFVKSWTANLVRDPLVAALFGPATQSGACA